MSYEQVTRLLIIMGGVFFGAGCVLGALGFALWFGLL